MTTSASRELRNRAIAWFWILACCVFLLWLAGCTSAQWQRTKAHMVEDSMAAGGGATMVLLPFPYGFIVGIPLVAFAPVAGEVMRPPGPVTVVKTDKDGKTTVKTFQPKDSKDAPPPDTGWSISGLLSGFTWAFTKLLLLCVAAFVAIKVALSNRYRTMIWNAAKAILRLRPVVALKSMLAAEGTIHSGEVPIVQPRKTQDIVLDSVLPQPPNGD